MAHLATLAETKSALRIDADDDDSTLEIMIAAASRLVLRYIKGDAAEFDQIEAGGSEGEGPIDSADLERLRLATIMLVGYWFRNPDADPDGDFERGYLPRPVTAMLYDLRDPTLA